MLPETPDIEAIVRAAIDAVPPRGGRQTYEGLADLRRKWAAENHPELLGKPGTLLAFNLTLARIVTELGTKPQPPFEKINPFSKLHHVVHVEGDQNQKGGADEQHQDIGGP